jgi:hypothetical protein
MTARKTKLLSAQTEVTTVNNDQTIILTDANGKVTRISLSNLKAALLSGYDLNAATDNVFIMTHRKSDDFPLAIKPQYWSDYQNSGEVAEGVLVIEGGHHLVVAPTESESTLLWSSADVNGNTVYGYYNDRVKAFSDFNGMQNTANIIKASSDSAVTNTASYAAGFCNLYSRTNANGKGLTAGRWWLPSIGELLMIYANMSKINYCLSLLSGATQLVRDWYWSSSESNAAGAWGLYLLAGGLGPGRVKSQNGRHVRAVSAFLQ